MSVFLKRARAKIRDFRHKFKPNPKNAQKKQRSLPPKWHFMGYNFENKKIQLLKHPKKQVKTYFCQHRARTVTKIYHIRRFCDKNCKQLLHHTAHKKHKNRVKKNDCLIFEHRARARCSCNLYNHNIQV